MLPRMDLFGVRDKVALVTGGSSGIGKMITTGYVEAGMRVYIASRKQAEHEATCRELAGRGACFAIAADLSTTAGVDALVAELGRREPALDVLVNNAGANWGAPLETYPEAAWDKVMDLNVKSAFFLTQRLLPALRRAKAPARVINISSIHGLTPPPLETYAYSTSKAALLMLTRHLARRLAPDVLVNAIAPGPFPSRMMRATLDQLGEQIAQANPLRRLGGPEDIAGVALFLAARASAYTTGAVIPCDGGAAELGSLF